MLSKKLTADYITAMKAKDSFRVSTINFLRAQIKNVMIDRKIDELDDVEVITIIKKQVKQRQDSIEQFTKGGRKDLADKEQSELEILKEYLPEEMSAEQLEPIVNEAIKEVGATSMKEMGLVMKAVAVKVAGKADNKLVSELVRKALGSL